METTLAWLAKRGVGMVLICLIFLVGAPIGIAQSSLRSLQVVSTNIALGAAVTVPVRMVSLGNENALAFSLAFDPSRLVFAGVTLGAGAGGTSLLLATNQAGSGQVGISVAQNPGQTFAAGTLELVRVSFTAGSTLGATAVSFSDVPLAREVVDVNVNDLAATYINGTITILPALVPTVTITSPTNGASFTAPASILLSATAGESGGSISKVSFYQGTNLLGTVGDSPYSYAWSNVAVGIYSLMAVATDSAGLTATSSNVSITVTSPPLPRTLQVVSTNAVTGAVVSLPVEMVSLGDENAVAFSLAFDPTYLAFAGVSLGSGVGGTVLLVSSNQAGSGQVGISVAQSPGQMFAAGTLELVQVNFTAGPTAGTTAVSFADSPLVREIVDVNVNDLAATYVNGTVSIAPEAWLPYVPTAAQTSISVFETNGTWQALVTIEFPDLCYRVADWGALARAASDFSVSAQIEQAPPGSLCGQVLWSASYTYDLGVLSPGSYSFIFESWGTEVTQLAFNVPSPPTPTVWITSPTNGASFTAPASIILSASASESGGSISNVAFYQGTRLLGAVGSSPYNYTWSNVKAGSYILTAVATDNAGVTAVSTGLTINVISPIRTLQILSTNAITGAAVTVPVQMVSLGNENALAFSLAFDPSRLAFVSATLGSGADATNLLVSTTQAASGQVGISVAQNPGQTFAAGTLELVRVSFTAGSTAGATTVSFADTPLAREVVDVNANGLAATYVNGTVNVRPAGPILGVALAGNVFSVTLTGSPGDSYIMQTSSDLTTWSLVGPALTAGPDGKVGYQTTVNNLGGHYFRAFLQ